MVSNEDVKYLSGLCKIKFSEEEIEDFTEEFSKILDYVNILKEVDTEGIEPTYHIGNNIQPLREDEIDKSLDKEDVLKNAPEEEYGYFKLLRVMD
ncbi:Asp-tRNA(Asn)/Glu-tRNA(Gln) amidotransferase subunit GatC [Clostridium sp. Cult2]|uniref:Asp-tRNA(Asn)/Glu-tRNA(Gln) amidotransferase subunit GatC n=1 Tax=Clostridium sp. Cult2 TaxID=2079003 RepID=UPI001F0153F7|nr:Asp-tRNA(Asn)/Glu-tRNA(Gln) amidotransferase subunit GatC [Clostridium sp. Cult2]MCF6465409.1 Asp-tRNA(Asn)/Glu-tRNA(Gln) amidotransferase GatCAB subunit C [Clostridium sp. Cult2]